MRRRRPTTKRTGPKYPDTGGFASPPGAAQGMWKVCPVCQKRYPGPLGHACSGPPR